MFFKLLLTRQKFFKFIFSSTCFFQSCFLISVGNFSDFFSLICFCNRQVKFSFDICISFVKTCLFKLESYFVMFTSDPSFFRKSSLICSLITSTSVSDELLALFLNHFFRKYTAQSRAKLSWTQRQRIICNRLWKQPADWQVLCLRDWNSFSCFVIFLLRVLLPTLNVDVNPKKPAKPADLKMSTEVILRSLEGAGRGALSFLSRGPQRDPSPEGAGRGAVNSSG